MSNKTSSFLTLAFASLFLISLGMISHNAFADQVIGNIPTGPVPVSVGVNPQTNMIYVANFGWFGHYNGTCNNTVTVVNGSTNSVASTITVGHCPMGVGINPNTNRIYVVNQNDNTTSVIDGSTNSIVSTIQVGQPPDDAYTNLAVNPATDKIYVTTHAGVVVIDGSTNQVVDTIHIGDQYCPDIDHVAVNPDTGRIYVATLCYHKSFDMLTVVDGSTDTVIDTIRVGELFGADLAVNPTTNKIYVAKEPVTVIDGSTNTVTGTIDTFADRGVAVNPATNKVYVLSVFDNSTSIIDGSMDILTGKISGFDIPWGAAVNSVTNRVYVTNEGNDTVSVIKSSKPEGIILENLKSTSGTTSSSNHLALPSFKVGTLGNQLLLVGISANNNNVTSVTFGGVPLTRVAYSFYNNDAEFWYLTNPSSGTRNIVATFFGPTQAVMGAYSFANVNQTDPIPTHAAGTDKQSTGSPTIYLTTKYPNDLMLDLPSIWGGVTLTPFYDSDCTEKWDINVPGEITGASSLRLVPAPAFAYCDWTASSGDRWDDVAVEVRSTAPAPSAPQNLVATAGNAYVSFSWSAPAPNGESAITSYNLYRGTSSGAESLLTPVSGSAISFTDTTVTNGVTYYYYLTSANSAGTSSPSNEVNATPVVPPQLPTGLAATALSSSQINLNWTAPANNGSPITGYMIQRSTDNGTTWSTIASNTGSMDTKYNDTGLSASTAYTYQISAINAVGTSGPSNTSSATTSSVTTTGIALNNVQSTSGTTSSSDQLTLPIFTVGAGSNQLMLVGISANNNNVTSVTFGGVPLTRTAYSYTNNDAEFWYLANPSGSGDIVVTFWGPTQAVVGAYSLSGINPTSPIAGTAKVHNLSASSPAISITTKYPNDLVLDLPSIYGGSTLSSPTCTPQWNLNVPNQITGASSSTMMQSPTTVACKWAASSADFWDDVAVELKAN